MGASNLHYADWEQHFAMADELVAFGTAGVTPKTLPAIGTPDAKIDPAFLDSGATARGRAERNQDEFDVGDIASGATFQTRMGNVFLYKFLASLLQVKPAGVETPAPSGKFKHTFTVYSGQPSANIGMTIWQALRAGAANDARLTQGNVVKSLKIASATGKQCTTDIETIALTGARGTLSTPGSAWTNALQYLHRHLITAKINTVAIAPAPSDVNATLVNTAVPWNGTSQTPTEIVLGIFGITGDLTITARGIGMAEWAAFNARTNRAFDFGWGTAVDDVGYFEMLFDATYSSFARVSVGGIQGVKLGFTHALAASAPTTTTFNLWHSADLSV